MTSIEHLIKQLQSSDPGECAAGAAALGSMGQEAEEALPSLFAAMEDFDEGVQRQARIAIKRISGHSAGSLEEIIAQGQKEKKS